MTTCATASFSVFITNEKRVHNVFESTMFASVFAQNVGYTLSRTPRCVHTNELYTPEIRQVLVENVGDSFLISYKYVIRCIHYKYVLQTLRNSPEVKQSSAYDEVLG